MVRSSTQWQSPGVIFQPNVARGFQRGVHLLVSAIAPTLGPLPRMVALEQIDRDKRPALLDDGAAIARRLLMLPDRDEDVGAMYLRQMLCKVRDLAGDGTAATAVIFQSIFDQGLRYLAAGGSSAILRTYLEQGAQLIARELDRMTLPIEDRGQLVALANAICHDPPLAEALGEVFDTIGEYSRLDMHPGNSRDIERKYVEGNYWEGGLINRKMASDPSGKIWLEDVPILITDFSIQDPQDLFPIVQIAAQTGIKTLILTVTEMSEQIVTLLMMPANRERINIVVIKSRALTDSVNREGLHDLAILTGGTALLEKAGYTMRNIKPEYFGKARRAWADKDFFGILGGKGDSHQLRRHIADLKHAYHNATQDLVRKRIQDRLYTLVGGSAELWIGAATSIEKESRQEAATRTAQVMRGALREGIVAGGGVALLNCEARLREQLRCAETTDERAALRMLLTAIETPFRTLVANAGYVPDKVLADLCQRESGYGFDVISGQVTHMNDAGYFDPASVVKTAVTSAIHGAALALTIDAIVRRANPPQEVNP